MKAPAAVVTLALVLAGCASVGGPLEQRTTQGPTAEDLWTLRVVMANGRPPSFDERRHWEREMDERISAYFRDHPEAANAVDVASFRLDRRVTVGMSKDQVVLLLGAPAALTSDGAEMEKLARRFWPSLRGSATEAWTYPLGWRLFFAGARLIDITQYLER